MAITLKTHKLLWGDSGNQCAKCKSRVVEEATATDDASIVGEEAHIVSNKKNGPRYDDPLPKKDRDKFDNLLILCSRCHKVVDDQSNGFTVAVLRKMKADHAAEVLSKLGARKEQKLRPVIQSEKLSTWGIPIRLPVTPDGKGINSEVLAKFSNFLHDCFSRCFIHTCIATEQEDFVFLLTFASTDRATDPGFISCDLEVCCHITEFVKTAEEWMSVFVEGVSDVMPRLLEVGGRQKLHIHSQFGRLMPHRMYRMPPSDIMIEEVDGLPKGRNKPMNTSTLLCLLAAMLKGDGLLFIDDAEQYTNLPEVMKVVDRVGKGFRFSDIRLDRKDPEKWEYAG